MTSHKSTRFISDTWEDYALIDSGDGSKLERFNQYVLDRPEPVAVWPKDLNLSKWDKADASFEPTGKMKGYWQNIANVPEKWMLEYRSPNHESLKLKFQLEMTRFKHVGVFPEQATNWEYIVRKINEGDRLLNFLHVTSRNPIVTIIIVLVSCLAQICIQLGCLKTSKKDLLEPRLLSMTTT